MLSRAGVECQQHSSYSQPGTSPRAWRLLWIDNDQSPSVYQNQVKLTYYGQTGQVAEYPGNWPRCATHLR